MNIKIRSIVTFLIVFGLILIITACGGNSNSSNTGNAANSDENENTNSDEKVQITHAILGDFPHKNKFIESMGETLNLDIEIEKLPVEDFLDLYREKVATNNLPDLITHHGTSTIRRDLQPEENVLDLSDTDIVDDILDDLYEYYEEEDGKVYGVPAGSVQFAGILYNKRIFKEADVDVPETLDELVEISGKIKAIDKTPFYLAGDELSALQTPGIAAFAYDQLHDEEIMDKINNNEASFADAQNFIDAYHTLLTLFDKGYTNSDYLSGNNKDGLEAVVKGNTAMLPIIYVDYFGEMQEKYPDKIEDLGFFIWPVEGEKVAATRLPPVYGINKASENIDAVKRFLEHNASNEGQNIYYESYYPSIGAPAYKDINIDDSLLPAYTQDLIEVSDTTKKFRMFTAQTFTYIGLYNDYVKSVLQKEMTPEELAEAFMEDLRDKGRQEGREGF